MPPSNAVTAAETIRQRWLRWLQALAEDMDRDVVGEHEVRIARLEREIADVKTGLRIMADISGDAASSSTEQHRT